MTGADEPVSGADGPVGGVDEGAPEWPGVVAVIGGRGEFGSFLRDTVLPGLGVSASYSIDRDTAPGLRSEILARARHVVLSTPLAGYPAMAGALVHECRFHTAPVTLWLIPSVQTATHHEVREALERAANPRLSVVFAHPMYGPRGFAASEREASTFRNILTATASGRAHDLSGEVAVVRRAFQTELGIATSTGFDPAEHDRITAASQGLSYCFAGAMFEHPSVDLEVAETLPDLHRSFHADRELIRDFVRANSFVRQVAAAFAAHHDRARGAGMARLLSAFAQTDRELNGVGGSAIPTKWYRRLRRSAGREP